ncbi:hydrolase [Legionella norrlandica]|uniref:Hydrolase n=1 Tax=Legionella norrlandica TaxID=1498499 RepID=A0A0A2SPQ2_9GAMM|nr:alpha/beta hydrolase [Legionella norrlandica]KGP63115.1 hydrolase [Legionella norrlandica]
MSFTDYGYRLNQIQEGSEKNWLFLPGGPGLGSEYLTHFCSNLAIQGTVILVDFPKDGTNKEGQLDFTFWQKGLIALLQSFNNPILVTHSFSGMFAMNLPEIENHLGGLILMNTTTSNTFFQHVSEMRHKHHLPDLVPAASQYHLDPSDETYKKFWDTYKYYCFTKEELPLGEQMMNLFAYNNDSYHYAIEHFYLDFHYKWHPQAIPAMTIASEFDYICPPAIFIKDKNFQSKNIMNKMIYNAGHCPWILHLEEVQQCFDEFSSIIPI